MCIFWLISLNTPYVSLKAASSVDLFFLEPYCCVPSMLLVCRCWLNLLCIAFLSTLEQIVNNEINLEFVIQVLSLFLYSGFATAILRQPGKILVYSE